MDKCCGTCKWWEKKSEDVRVQNSAIGICSYPLPFWIERLNPYGHAGLGCPTWEARDA